jgi:hypothetical protein
MHLSRATSKNEATLVQKPWGPRTKLCFGRGY